MLIFCAAPSGIRPMRRASIVLLAFQQAADVHTFGAQVTATLTIWPRSRWELDS